MPRYGTTAEKAKCRLINRAGLCVVEKSSKRIYVIQRQRPYTKQCNPHKFVEQYSIPRGKQIKSTESLQNCAIREFIEETGHFFKKIEILPQQFILRWINPENTLWEYKIYFAITSFHKSNFYQFSSPHNSSGSNFINKRNWYFEPYKPYIIPFDTYRNLVAERLHLYGENNYHRFFVFIEKLMIP